MNDRGEPLATGAVAERLRRGRVRLAAASLAAGSVSAIAVGTVAAAAVAVARLLAPRWGVEAFDAATVVAVGIGAAAVAWLVLVGVALLRLPTLLALARLGERKLDLEERLSAALEVAAAADDGYRAPVHAALLRDAAARAELLTPDLFAPRFPRRAMAVAAGGVLVLAVALATPAPTPQVTAGATAAPTDRAATLDVLREAAAAVALDAAEREDAYLAALARALDRLGTDLETGRLGDREVAEEIDRLVDHLGRAYGHEPEAARDLGATLAMEGHQLDVAERGGALAPDSVRADDATAAAADDVGDEDRTTLFADEADVVTEGERTPLERGEAPDQGAFAQNLDLDVEDLYDHDVEGMLEALARIGADTPQGDRALPGAGAEGDAGFGVAPLFADDAAPLPEWQDLAGERLELPDDPGTNRIRISVPPEVRLAALGDGGVGDGRWPRGHEAAIGVDRMGVRHRDTVRAYFIATTAEAAGTTP